MVRTGAEIIIECLKEQGVDVVFGYPGGSILNVYDALYKHSDEIFHVLTSHEQGAAHAADGYARATGKVGVCMATSGPGATNLVTGIATAYMDSVPMVAITCNVTLPLLGKDSFQEVDIAGVTMPITKHGYIVKDVNILADTLRKAFHIAKSGRPGPVLVDITKDVTAASCEYTPKKPESIERAGHYTQEDLDAALEVISKAKKPYIYLGGGAILSGASEEVRAFAKKLDSPVCDTLMGKGAYDGYDPLYTGMIGMHGTKTSNLGVSECDLLVALGARFSDRVIGNASLFAKNAKIIHIDIDAASISRNIEVDIPIVADAKLAITKMLKYAKKLDISDWVAEIMEVKKQYPINMNSYKGVTPEKIIKTINEMYDDLIITTDVGQNQLWTTQYIALGGENQLLTSGGLGTMGYGLPAAIGAKIGNPDKNVICISGDGGVQMNIQEMATAVAQELPITICILNNGYLGNVRQWQELFFNKRYSSTCLRYRKSCNHDCQNPDKCCPKYTPDFVKLAESYEALGIRVTKEEEIKAAFEQAKANTKGPTVIEFYIDPTANVFPMVPGGKSLNDMIMDC